MPVPSPLIISNTSPLIKLAAVGHLDLLSLLYGTVTIPAQVRDEYRAGVAPGDPDLDSLTWLRVQAVSIAPDLLALSSLGVGEAAVLTLAQAQSAQLVILDDHAARRVAQARGLVLTGTFGVLIAAKQSGHLVAIKPILDMMIDQGRRISPPLRADLLRLAGEAEQ
jgi:predicted nucleic acid-binding protein